MFLKFTHQTRLRKRWLFILILILSLNKSFSQNGVAINTTGASADNSAILDLTNSLGNKGLLLPKVTLTSAVTTPVATGLVVYQTGGTPGIYYYTGSSWLFLGSGNGTVTSVSSGNLSPLFTTSVANSTTTPTLSFTLSSANAHTFFGNFTNAATTPSFGSPNLASADFANQGTTTTLLHGNTAGNPSWGQVGLTTDITGILPVANGGTGVSTTTANYVFAGPNGSNGAPSFRALVAADIPSGNGNYIQNQAALSQTANYYISGPASIGIANSATASLNVATSTAANNAIVGSNTAASGSNVGDGVDGFTIQSKGVGVYGYNTNSSGTGIIGAGNNVSGGGYFLTAGSGGAFTGSTTGLYATYTSSSSGTSALYTSDNTGSNTVAVNYWSGSTQYKIIGSGSVSTVAESLDNKSKVVLHAPEAPEILFEDYGQGKLKNGFVHITIDPVFAKNVTINDKHPLRVFIQLEGDCNGVFVTNKTNSGFDVVELKKGNSNVPFQWHIVCNRADEDFGNGKISKNTDMRFEQAPQEMQSIKAKHENGSANSFQK